MNPIALLGLALALGLRHAADPDPGGVVALTAGSKLSHYGIVAQLRPS